MKVKEYLSDRKVLILLYTATAIFTGMCMYLDESVSFLQSNGMYAIEISLLLFIIYLTIDFLIKRNYYNKLGEISSEGLDWVESLPTPANIEQRRNHELLRRLYGNANKSLEEHHTKSAEDLEFITMWVHEIKTPIAASKLIIENSLNNPTEKALYSVQDEIDKIEDFVQMTLFYSRAGDFAKDYMINSVSLKKVVNDCLKREFSSITNKNINLKLDNLEVFIDTDEKWLGFIIKQILDNAIKYSASGGEIKIYLEQKDTEKILNIQDNGMGIKEEDIGRIFDNNFTGENGRKFYNATGIGLYLSRKLAAKLGHFLTVTSDYGHGTMVSIHFPKWHDYYEDVIK